MGHPWHRQSVAIAVDLEHRLYQIRGGVPLLGQKFILAIVRIDHPFFREDRQSSEWLNSELRSRLLLGGQWLEVSDA